MRIKLGGQAVMRRECSAFYFAKIWGGQIPVTPLNTGNMILRPNVEHKTQFCCLSKYPRN